MLKVIILAGGRGERLWPLARRRRPKPFLALASRESLLRSTWRRAKAVARAGSISVMSPDRLHGAIRRDLRGLGPVRLLSEPAARNTGPAALLAARREWAERHRGEMLTLPADHRITGLPAFRAAISEARRLARLGYLVTFGVPPAGPRPEFGYIVPGKRLGSGSRRVARFVEKPSARTARHLISRQGALWNSGMFVWRADDFLREAARCEPSFAGWLSRCGSARDIPPAALRAFRLLPDLPVDRAVLERSDRVAVVEARFGWSDLGSWSALEEILPADSDGNRAWGNLVTLGARRNLALHEGGGLTVLSGVKGVMVVRAGGVVLVCPRSRGERIREILREIERRGHGHFL
jgi:mannose-1-phosphate guanylyltransferase